MKIKNRISSDYPFCLFQIPEEGGRVIWELTNRCNYKCIYCIFNCTQKASHELSTPKIMLTLHELKKNGFTFLKLTGGEPFIRKDIMGILTYASKLGFVVDISTNGSLITEDMAAKIAELDIKVHVSLDGSTKESHEAVRGVDTFAPTVRGIKLLTKNGVRVRIGTVISKYNENEFLNIVKFCSSLQAQEVIFSLMEPVGRLKGKTDILSSRDQEDLISELSELKEQFNDKITVSYSFTENIKEACGAKCPGGKKFLSINHQGVVSPCPWVSQRASHFVPKSTLRDKSLKEILSEEFISFNDFINRVKDEKLNTCPMARDDRVERFRQEYQINHKTPEKEFSEYSKIYAFTTENIKGYLDHLSLTGKRVLTVGGSGDQMINAYLDGASEVVNFDINFYARYFAELKFVALQEFDFETFLKFFMRSNESFSFSLYKEIRGRLTAATRHFFDCSFVKFSYKGNLLRNSEYFNILYDDPVSKTAYNKYLADANTYERAQKICRTKKFEWLVGSVADVLKMDIGQYDVIMLSNIADYAHKMYTGSKYLEKFRDLVVIPMIDKLKIDGELVVAYVYDAVREEYDNCRTDVDKPWQRKKVFGRIKNTHYREVVFPGAIKDKHDLISILKKTE